ncbi:MAG: GNAT family N-acetyltransferase [Gemmatimonadaceae bacterium]
MRGALEIGSAASTGARASRRSIAPFVRWYAAPIRIMHIERVATRALPERTLVELRELCDLAYGQPVFDTFGGAEHVLGWERGRLVAHAMWIRRWLQPLGWAPLATAYVELVATHPNDRNRGYATAIMERVAAEIADEEWGALSPATEGLYSRLGWQVWSGPLFVRTPDGLKSTPDDHVMVLPLLRTPALDMQAPLSIEWRPGEVW